MEKPEKPIDKLFNNKDLNAFLTEETGKRFKIVNMKRRTSPVFRVKEGEFDLRTLSIKQAEALVKRKANWIEEIKTPEKTK